MSGFFFNDYPYTDFHELNLTWIIKKIIELNETVKTFVSLDSIKYADPIQWNITTQYEKNTVVIDPGTGTAYLSVSPVPSGVALSNTDYWTVVFDLSAFITKAAENFTNRIETQTTTATFSSAVGDWIMIDDVLYHAISAIGAGDTYVVGSNIEHITMENLYDLIIDILEEINNTKIPNIESAIQTISTLIATNRKVICIGDSYLGGSGPAYAESDSWGAKLRELLNNGSDTIIKGYGGSGFIGQPGASDHTYILQLQDAASSLTDDEKAAITDIVAIGGHNDKYGLTNNTYTAADISNAIYSFCNYAHATFPNAMIRIGVACWATDGLSDKQYLATILNCFERCATGYAPSKVQYMAGLEYIMPTIKDSDYMDNIHPDVDASKLIAEGVLNCMMGANGAIVKNYTNADFALTYETGITETTHNMKLDIYGNVATVKIGTLWFNYGSPVTYTYGSEILIGEIDTDVPIRASLGINIPASIWYDTGGGSNEVRDGYIKILNRKVYLFINAPLGTTETLSSVIVKCSNYSDSVFNIC